MKKLLFIAGIPHSGTSLLDKILDLHEEISSIVDYSKDPVDLIENELNIFSSQKELDNYINKFNFKETQYLLMKNPHNLDFIDKILSIKSYNTKVIIIYRDIRDVALSLFYRNDSMWPDYESAIKYCVEKYKIIEKSSSSILKINYDDIINNFDTVFNNISNYLEISNNNNDIIKRFEANTCKKQIPEDKNHIDRRRTQLKKKIYNSSRFENETTEAQKIVYNKYVKNIDILKNTLFIL
tara:strand:- start:44 stop:760 length:717 start_codon:yes stop_codon:yes gene_type:complete